MVIITIAAVFCLISLAMNLIFLSGFSISHFIGFAAGASEITAGNDLIIIDLGGVCTRDCHPREFDPRVIDPTGH